MRVRVTIDSDELDELEAAYAEAGVDVQSLVAEEEEDIDDAISRTERLIRNLEIATEVAIAMKVAYGKVKEAVG